MMTHTIAYRTSSSFAARGLATALLALLALALPRIARADIPALRLAEAPLVTPAAAFGYYDSLPDAAQHSAGVAAGDGTAPELKVLADALNRHGDGSLTRASYAQNVYEYVRQNIDIELRFGLGKGARGALIDHSGTAFDQAQLMVELLRLGGVSASYQLGTITLDAQQFGQWTGLVTNLAQATPPALPTFVVDARSACRLLADGGIPATVNGQSSCDALSGPLSTVTLAHVWVTALGNAYDPAFKRYNLRAGLDLAATMSCGSDAAPTCGDSALNITLRGAVSGTVAGAATLTRLNEAGLGQLLNAWSGRLQQTVDASMPDAPLEELIGGRRAERTMFVSAGAQLPYPASVRATWSGDIPDGYRTRFRYHFGAVDPLMFADEIYGKRIERLSVEDLGSIEITLFIDDVAAAHQPPVEKFPALPFEVVVDHPYAANGGTYADERRDEVLFSNEPSQVIMLGLGNTGPGLVRHFADREKALPQNIFIRSLASPFPVAPGALSIALAAQVLYQESLAVRALEGITKTRITPHHSLAFTFPDGGPGALISKSAQLSVSAHGGDEIARRTAFETLAVASDMLEGSVSQQMQGTALPFSGVSLFSLKNSRGVTFVDARAANIEALIPTLRQYYFEAPLRARAAQGYDFILPLSGPNDGNAFPLVGGTLQTSFYTQLAYRSDSIAYLLNEEFKGGGGGFGIGDALSNALAAAPSPASDPSAQGAIDVDLSSGDFSLQTPPDLRTGVGGFPYELAFQRTYRSRNSFAELTTGVSNTPAFQPLRKYYGSDQNSFTRLGGGWTHNFQITATIDNDGAIGLGSERALDAASAIAGLYAIASLQRGPGFASRLTAALTAHWISQRFLANVATIERPQAVRRFVRRVDGNYAPPSGSAERLVQSGERSTAFCKPCDDTNGFVTGFDYRNVRLSYIDRDGSAIALSPSDFSSAGARPVFAADSWTFATGVRIDFQYQTVTLRNAAVDSSRRILSRVSNNLGRSLTFTSSLRDDQQTPTSRELVPLNERTQLTDQFGVIDRVTDETGRSVRFERKCTLLQDGLASIPGGPYGCDTFEVITPDGARSVFAYGFAPPLTTDARIRPVYRLQRWFTPDDLNSAFMTFSYDALFRLRGVRDRSGNLTSYATSGLFNERLGIGELIDAENGITRQFFDEDGRVLATFDPLGRFSTNRYDDAGRLVEATSPGQRVQLFNYDARSNLLSIVDRPRPGSGLPERVTSSAYLEGPTVRTCLNPASCNLPTTLTDFGGRTTNFNFDLATGQLLRIEGPAVPLDGQLRPSSNIYCYSSLTAPGGGQLTLVTGQIEQLTDTSRRVAAISYDPANKLVPLAITSDPMQTLLPPLVPLSRTCQTASKGNALALTTRFSYNAVGDLTGVDLPRTDVADSTSYQLDAMRRLTAVSSPLGVTTLFEYRPDGALSRKLNATVADPVTGAASDWAIETIDYYPNGLLRSVTDPKGRLARLVYDKVGRQTLSVDPDGRGDATVYDAAGQVACTFSGVQGDTPPADCAFDSAAYLTAGAIGAVRTAAFAYNEEGQVTRVLDARGAATQSHYDGFGRAAFTTFPDPATGATCSLPLQVTTASQPSCSVGQTYTQSSFDLNDDVLRVRTRRGDTIDFSYDAQDRVLTKAATGMPTVSYRYNLDGDPVAIESPAQGAIAARGIVYGYDDLGRRTSQDTLLAGGYKRVSFAFDGDDNRVRTQWPDGYFVSYEYDALGRMTAARENGDGELASYSYDLLSRRSELRFAANAQNRIGYSYDVDSTLSRLENGLDGQTVSLDYLYNASTQLQQLSASNRFFLPQPGPGVANSYASNGLNQYSSIENQPATYDLAGNLTSWFNVRGKQSYGYDPENRLLSAAVDGATSPNVFYEYDGLGRRVSKRVNGRLTQYLYDGDEEIAELDENDVIQRRYVLGPHFDDRIARVEGTTKLYYHVDQQGSVIAMTDGAGATTQQFSYDEYGNVVAELPALSSNDEQFRFTGRRFDHETGLYYYRARYYAPELGRFLQTDPIGIDGGTNQYSYVDNDPANRTDPTGRFAFIGAAISGGIQLGFEIYKLSTSDKPLTLVELRKSTARVLVSAAVGFVGGGFAQFAVKLASPALRVAAGTLLSGVLSAGQKVINKKYIDREEFDRYDVLAAGLTGAAFSALGGSLGEIAIRAGKVAALTFAKLNVPLNARLAIANIVNTSRTVTASQGLNRASPNKFPLANLGFGIGNLSNTDITSQPDFGSFGLPIEISVNLSLRRLFSNGCRSGPTVADGCF